MTEKLNIKGRVIFPKIKIYNNDFKIDPSGIIFIRAEKEQFNYGKKNSELIQKTDALINYLEKKNFENKDEIISQIKLKKIQNEEYGKNFVEEMEKFSLYYNNYKKIISQHETKFNAFFLNKKNYNENVMLLEISVDIQRKIARMFYDLLNNYEHLCNLYDEDNQIIDEYCKKYHFNYNIQSI